MSSQDEALKRMSKLVNSLMAKPDSGPFREPVDWRGLELFDYPKIVKKMMDLGTIKRKLERSLYNNAYECAQDIRLIWKNCMSYNADGSDFWLLAKSFSRKFEDRYKKIKADYDVGEDELMVVSETSPDNSNSKRASSKSPKNADGVSLDDRAELARRIFLLNGTELGHVLTTIENRCPDALEEAGGSDFMEINVDALDMATFKGLTTYVKDKVKARHGTNIDSAPEESGNKASASGNHKKRKK